MCSRFGGIINKIIDIPEIGLVNIYKSKRSKNLRITIKSTSEVRISIPYFMSYSSAIKFAKEKHEWIISKQRQFSESKNNIEFGSVIQTKLRTIQILKNNIDTAYAVIKEQKDNTNILLPANFHFQNQFSQKLLHSIVSDILRKDAKNYLPERVSFLANKNGLTFNRVFIKNIKSRWGSCSIKNNINLCLHLMRLPHNLIDYVILHELAHTIHKNHSKDFWNYLEYLVSDAKDLDKELKNYSILHF